MGIAKRGLVPNLSVWIGLILDLLYDEDIGAAAEEQQNTTGISDTDVDAAEIPASRKHRRKPLPDHLDCEDEVLSSCDDCVDGAGKRWPAWCMSAASSTMSPNRAARLSPKKPLSGLARVMT
jgi:hypothetical protein